MLPGMITATPRAEMDAAMTYVSREPETELPVTAYPYYRQVFGSANVAAATGMLFDSKQFSVMAITQPADSRTPDLNADKEGDRILLCLDGVRFGKTSSVRGARMLLVRGKALRSFSMYR
jgi:hypothetical protein